MKRSAPGAGSVTSFALSAPLNSTKKKNKVISSALYAKGVAFVLQPVHHQQSRAGTLQITRYLPRLMDYSARSECNLY
jgi:hypothetical protein